MSHKVKSSELNGKGLYFVAFKVFLRKGNKLLVLKDSFGRWDLPGGRMLPEEFGKPIDKIIARKIKEELGGVKYKLGQPVVFMRHERQESVSGGKLKVQIFAIGYEAKMTGGEIKLSKRHTEMSWEDIKTFQPEKKFKGGWLRGVKEYLALANSNS